MWIVLLAAAAAAALPSSKRVVLVTGANKGIGKEIARTVGLLPDHVVVLGCRDEALGDAAAALGSASRHVAATLRRRRRMLDRRYE